MKELSIIKIGGQVLADDTKLQQTLQAFAGLEGPKILVHGGGKTASELSRKLGFKAHIVAGRRITDQASLEVATMVYAGLINKKIVSQLQKFECNALGLSGADGSLILAQKRPVKEIDYGFVGDILQVNTALLNSLISQNIVPVCCAITHDGQGQLLNTNADTIAAQLAAALAPDYELTLKFCFEKPGVLAKPEDDTSAFTFLSESEYIVQQKNGSITAGMIPKLDNAFVAKKSKVRKVFICGLEGILEPKGTEICL